VPDAAPPGLLAGLALRHSERRHLTLGVRTLGNGRVVELVLHDGGEDRVLGRTEVPAGRVGLVLEVDGFAAIARLEHDGQLLDVGSADLAPLSPSSGGGFTGVVGGVFAVGAPGTDERVAGAAWADFDLLSLVHPPAPA
jgi:alpha-N-arabinofuranosidase